MQLLMVQNIIERGNDVKMKTTKFRELLGRKLVYSMIITIFKRYDLIGKEKFEDKL